MIANTGMRLALFAVMLSAAYGGFDPAAFFHNPYPFECVVPSSGIVDLEAFERTIVQVAPKETKIIPSWNVVGATVETVVYHTELYDATFFRHSATGDWYFLKTMISKNSLRLKYGIACGMPESELLKVIASVKYSKSKTDYIVCVPDNWRWQICFVFKEGKLTSVTLSDGD